jgi:O-antigen/teichoic acid export membrane protein
VTTVTAGILTRTRAHVREPLYRSAYSLIVNTGLNAVLGLGFWVVAARLYPADEVGRDSVLIATMMTLASICQLNLGNAIPRFLPQVADPARTLRKAYLASGAVAFVVASGFVLIAGQIPGDSQVLAEEPLLAVAFVAGTMLWCVFTLQDAALVAMRQAPWVPLENAVFGGLKLAALPALLVFGGVHAIFVAWVGPMALLLVPVNALLFFRVLPAHRKKHARSSRIEEIGRGPLLRFLAQDYAATVLALTSITILPLLVLSILGSTEAAFFYIAYTIVVSLELLVTSMGTSLTVESAFDERRLQSLARMVVRRTLIVAVPLSAFLTLVAPLILKPFGPEYVEGATPLLRLLLIALVFRTVIILFVAISRCRRRGRTLLAVDSALFVLLIGLTILLTPSMGLEGAGFAFLVADAVVALAVIPSMVRFLRRREPAEGAVEDPSAGPVPLVAPSTAASPRLAPRRAPRAPLAPGARLILAAAATACLASLALMAVGVQGGPTTLALVLMFALAPGAALLPLIGARELSLGLVLGTSLGVSTLLAMGMTWLSWQPVAASYGLAAICIPAIAFTLLTRDRAVRVTPEPPAATGAESALGRWLRLPATQVVILASAAIAWAAGLSTTDLDRMDGYGLLAAVGPGWFLALGLLAVGFPLTLWARPRIPGIFGAYVTGLVIIVHGTTAVLYDFPRYSWTYKHLGVVESLIASGGHLDRSLDIYNNWPGFFALGAWLSESAGVGPITYAGWAQVFFSLCDVAALMFALRGLAISERVRWTTVWLFVVADWVGQNYFAPQALAFALALVVIGICLRCAPEPVDGESRMDRWLRRRRSPTLRWVATMRRLRVPAGAQPLPGLAAMFVGAVVFLAIVMTHQLSPILVIAQVIAIWLISGRLPLWVPAAMLTVEAWWVTLAWPFVSSQWSLFDVDPTASAEDTGAHGVALPGVDVVSVAARLSLVLVCVVAVLGLIRLVQRSRAARPERRRRVDPVPIALAAAPFLIVGFQTYGGEGFLRASLFALPWLALLAAEGCAPRGGPSRRPSRHSFRLIGVTAVVGSLMLLAYFGPELQNRFTRSDVAAEVWYERNAPEGSLRAFYTPHAPLSMTKYYASKRMLPTGQPALSSLPEFDHRLHGLLGPVDVVRIRELLLESSATERYFMITPSQEKYAELYGYMLPQSAASLTAAFLRSPDFEVAFHDGDAYVFKLVPRPEDAPPPA